MTIIGAPRHRYVAVLATLFIAATPDSRLLAQQPAPIVTIARLFAPVPAWSFIGADHVYSRFADAPPTNVITWRGTADLFSTLGLPGTGEIAGDSRLALGIQRAEASGIFHRPLEADGIVQTSLIGSGSGSTSANTAAAGRFSIGRSTREGTTHSLTIEPYSELPYVPADTTTPSLERSEAEFEGALSGKTREWEYVLGAGYAAIDERSVRAPTARTIRNFAVGAGAGIAHHVPGPGGRVALGVRWREGGEQSSDSPNPGALRIYELSGMSEVEPRDITSAPSFFQRRRGRRRTLEGAYARPVFTVTPALYARHETFADRRTTVTRDAAPGDAWHASTSTYGLALTMPLTTVGVLSAAGESWTSTGEGRVSGLTAVVHRARRRGDRFRGSLLTGDSATRFGGLGVSGERYRDRTSDAVAELSTEREGWRWQMSAAAGSKIRSATVLLTYDLVMRGEGGLIPAGESLGDAFKRWVAPELEYYVAPTRAHTLGGVVLIPIAKRTTFVSFRRWKSFPTDFPGPFTPSGARTVTTISLGFLFDK